MSGSRPAVSILMPTYNHQAYIAQAIESVLAQSFSDWELLVVDDESTDGTPDVVRSHRDERIRYVRQTHRGIFGLADTYNRALGLARSDSIAILEGDDFWPPQRLGRLVAALSDSRAVLAYGITQHVNSAGALAPATTPTTRLLQRGPRDVLFNDPPGSALRVMCSPDEGVFTYPCSTLFRRAALDAIGGFATVEDRHAVDFATCMTLALQGTFQFIPEVTGYWRRHAAAANSSLRMRGMFEADARYATRFLERHGARIPPPRPDVQCIKQRWWRFLTGIPLTNGRVLLLQRRWREARREFVRALDQPSSPMRTMLASLGFACSCLHRSVEPLCRLRGPQHDLRRILAI